MQTATTRAAGRDARDTPTTRRGLAGQVGYLFASNLVDRVLGLIGAVIIARYLGASELGRIGPALVLGALAGRASDMGVSITLQRDIAREPRRAPHLLARALGFRGPSSGVALALVVAYALGTEGTTSRAWLPILAGLAAVLSGWFQTFASVWLACLRAEFVAIAQAIYRLLYLALIVVVLLLGQGSTAIMLALLCATIGQVSVAFAITRRAFFPPSIAVSRAASLDLVRESWPIGVSSFTVMAYDRVDTLVASWFLVPSAVGKYFAAYALYSATLTISSAITSVAFSAFSHHAHDVRLLVRHYRRTLAIVVGLGTGIATVYALFATTIVGMVYGTKYQGADDCLRVLALAVVFLFANNLAGSMLNAIGRQRVTMTLTASGLAFNVVANLLAVPRFGVLAAAWTTVATECLIAVTACGAAEYLVRRAVWSGGNHAGPDIGPSAVLALGSTGRNDA